MLTTNALQNVTDTELAQIEGGITPLGAFAAGVLVGAAIGAIAVYNRSGFKAEIGEDGMPIEEDYKDGPIVLK